MWKSRIDRDPPPQFWADIVAALSRAYPGARLSRERMQELSPFLADEWRSGQSAHDAAKATCACDGREIVPSPATAFALPKRSVRPPVGAVRGDVFVPEQLREPLTRAKLRVQAALAARRADYEEGRLAAIEGERGQTRSEAKRRKLTEEGLLARAAAATHRLAQQEHQAALDAELEKAGWTLWGDERVPWPLDTMPKAVRGRRTQAKPANEAAFAKPSGVVATSAVKSSETKIAAKVAKREKKACEPCKTLESQLGRQVEPAVRSEEQLELLVNQFAAAAMKDRKR